MIWTKMGIYFYGGAKKAQFFKPVESDASNGVVPPVRIFIRDRVRFWGLNVILLFKKTFLIHFEVGNQSRLSGRESLESVQAIRKSYPFPIRTCMRKIVLLVERGRDLVF